MLKNPDGSVFQCDMWQPGLAIVDFTNPAACEWYASKLRKLCEMGVDTFKTDFGERIPTNVKYFNGADPIAMHNYYTYLYNKTVFNVLKEYYGENKACLFARSATVGGQKFPVHWGGDCSAEYTSMAETIRGGLSLCMSGFGYFSHDISGFEATATPDIYKRWSAFGLLSSHSRLHGNSSYRVPWLFDDEAVDVLRHFTKLKGRLMPYLWAQAIKTHNTGNERGDGEFYLPEGRWTDILNGKIYEGGRFYREKYDYFGLPCLAKPNSIIAYGDFKRGFEYDYLENTEFVIYQPEDGREITCDIFDIETNKVFTLTAVRHGSTVEVKFDKTVKAFSVKVAGGESVSVQPGSISVTINI